MAKKTLEEFDILEILDMKDDEFKKYSKKELISFIWFQAQCLHDEEVKKAEYESSYGTF